jgi:hypothetical protein
MRRREDGPSEAWGRIAASTADEAAKQISFDVKRGLCPRLAVRLAYQVRIP